MTYCRDAWLGAWENFENYFTDENPAMIQSWVDAEASIKKNKKSLLSAFLFRKGAKRFWQDACYTTTKENPQKLFGWNVTASGAENLLITWLGEGEEVLGSFEYHLDEILPKGLESRENFLFAALDAPKGSPFTYLLSMEPFPEREAKKQGGLISHLHFQYASDREMLLKKNGRLRVPHWYATMCDGDATLLQRCNIIRAMHKLEIWTELPQASKMR